MANEEIIAWLQSQSVIIKTAMLTILSCIWLMAYDSLNSAVEMAQSAAQKEKKQAQKMEQLISTNIWESRLQQAEEYMAQSLETVFVSTSEALAKVAVDSWMRKVLSAHGIKNYGFNSSVVDSGANWLVSLEVTFTSKVPDTLDLLSDLYSDGRAFNWNEVQITNQGCRLQLEVPVWK